MLKKTLFTLLIAFFLAGGLSAEKGDKEKFSTKDIDVTIKDENGLNYFLVFDKVKDRATATAKYTVEFWVNDEVMIQVYEVHSLLFRTDDKNFGGMVSGSEDRYGKTGVLHFDIPEKEIQALAGKNGIKVRLVLKGESVFNMPFKDYKVDDEKALKKAISTILSK